MLNRYIARHEWQRYFDAFSRKYCKNGTPEYAEISIARPQTKGTPQAVLWLPLIGITYEPKEDVLEVAVEGLGRRTFHPEEIWAEVHMDGFVGTFLIRNQDGTREVITLRRRPALNAYRLRFPKSA